MGKLDNNDQKSCVHYDLPSYSLEQCWADCHRIRYNNWYLPVLSKETLAALTEGKEEGLSLSEVQGLVSSVRPLSEGLVRPPKVMNPLDTFCLTPGTLSHYAKMLFYTLPFVLFNFQCPYVRC